MVWIFWPSAHFRRMQTQRLGDGRGGGTLRTGVPEPQLRWQGGGRVDGEGLPPTSPGERRPKRIFGGGKPAPSSGQPACCTFCERSRERAGGASPQPRGRGKSAFSPNPSPGFSRFYLRTRRHFSRPWLEGTVEVTCGFARQ